MRAPEAFERRARTQRGRFGLLERDAALQAIGQLLEAAQSGVSGALLFEGHAGMGKTRLYGAALDEARELGLRVVRACGSELERNRAFGVAGSVLRALHHVLTDEEREELMASAPDAVVALLNAAEPAASGPLGADLAISHGLFSVVSAISEREPVLIAIDDLHWCDSASLEFILYLLQRLNELRVALVLTRRPTAGDGVFHELHQLAAHPRVRVHGLLALGVDAIDTLVSEVLGDAAQVDLVTICAEVTAGNPFYLHELLTALAETPDAEPDSLARRARTLAPDAVTRSLRVRVGRLGPAAAQLARAVAILGDDAALRHAATLAGLEPSEASSAADALAEVEVLLAREPLRFVHPLVRHAVQSDIPASERATRHLEAARLLDRDGVEVEHVAAHLLVGRAQGDPWAVERLRRAAQVAVHRSAPRSAIPYLQRALQEPPERDLRIEVLLELGTAEATAGDPAAIEHLDQALQETRHARRRAEVALALGRALIGQGRHQRASAVYEDGLAGLDAAQDDPLAASLRDELETGFLATALFVPALQSRAAARFEQLMSRAAQGPQTHGQRLVLAQAATRAVGGGVPADQVRALCDQAWDDGRLLAEEGADGLGWTLLVASLCLSGDLERCLELTDAVIADARDRTLPLAFASASFARALPLLWQGRVTDAMGELERAHDARRYGWQRFARAAASVQALCHIEAGELELAESILAAQAPADLLDADDLEEIAHNNVLARLRLVQGRPEEALEAALSVQAATARAGVRALGYAPWREIAVEARLLLGSSGPALELASEALELAESSQVLHERIRARRALALCHAGARRLELLHEAVDLGSQAPPRLETIRALVELGATLRRANRRAEAREPLQRAADLAHAGGASALFDQARTELAATGARPRRDVLLRGPKALTASELRIAELAAGGQSNREIAQALFVTAKTVEYHLRNAYRKLEIETRRELPGVLGRAG
jgi:DNA-binding CsgD family transcriptional regulator